MDVKLNLDLERMLLQRENETYAFQIYTVDQYGSKLDSLHNI